MLTVKSVNYVNPICNEMAACLKISCKKLHRLFLNNSGFKMTSSG